MGRFRTRLGKDISLYRPRIALFFDSSEGVADPSTTGISLSLARMMATSLPWYLGAVSCL